MKTFIIVLFLTLIASASLFSQVNQEWVQRFTSDSIRNEAVNDMFIDAQGNVYVTGSQRQTNANVDIQAVTVKYNSLGVQQWIQNYISPTNTGAFGRAIHVDAAGNVYVTGESNIYSGGANKMLVIKYSPTGTQLWSYLFSYSTAYNGGYDIVTDLTGNVYVAGEYNVNVTFLNNISVVKFNPNGALIGQTFYHFDSEGGRKITLDGAGKIIVGGYCNINQPDSARFIVLKYEQNLDFVWAVRCGSKGTGSPSSPFDMVVDINSNAIITGINNNDFATFKINSDGSLAWNKFYNFASDIPRGVVSDNSGNVYVTGETGAAGFPFSYRMTTIKYNSNGDEQWVNNYNGGNNPDGLRGYDIAIDNSANLYVTGARSSNADIVTAKYNVSGSLQWVMSYNGPSNSADNPVAVGVDANGNTYTTGTSNDNTTGYDIAIIKYSPVSLFQSQFSRNNVNKPITDNANTYDTILVNYSSLINYAVLDVNLKIDTVIHTNDSDLEFYLLHNGLTDTVIYQAGGSGDNFIGTVLNDSAANLLSGGTAPFSGAYRPYKPLSQFNNIDVNGSWILKIYDRQTGNTGTLKAWSLVLTIENNTIGIQNVSNEIPGGFSLSQNYPNPFNPVTNIKFQLPKTGYVKLIIFDMLGRELETLVNENLSAGTYKFDWNASGYSSGVYFYKLESKNFIQTKKMLIIK